MKPAVFLLSLCLLPLCATAEVYTWVDSEGRTHFGDRPPSKETAKEVRVKPQAPSVDVVAQERRENLTDFVEQRQQERDERNAELAKAEKAEAKRAERCRQLRARVEHQKSISAFYRVNEEGERVFMSDAENEKVRERYRAKMAEVCG